MRPAILAVVLLLLGAAVSVGIAWGGALSVGFAGAEVLEQYAQLGPTHHWLVHRWDIPAGTRIMSSVWDGGRAEPYNEGAPSDLLSAWGRIEVPDAARPRAARQIDEGWGFPLRAMACGFESVPGSAGAPAGRREHVWRLTAGSRPGAPAPYLPTRPIWPGLAADTLLYALSIMVAAALVRDGMRLLERSRRSPAAPVAAGLP